MNKIKVAPISIFETTVTRSKAKLALRKPKPLPKSRTSFSRPLPRYGTNRLKLSIRNLANMPRRGHRKVSLLKNSFKISKTGLCSSISRIYPGLRSTESELMARQP